MLSIISFFNEDLIINYNYIHNETNDVYENLTELIKHHSDLIKYGLYYDSQSNINGYYLNLKDSKTNLDLNVKYWHNNGLSKSDYKLIIENINTYVIETLNYRRANEIKEFDLQPSLESINDEQTLIELENEDLDDLKSMVFIAINEDITVDYFENCDIIKEYNESEGINYSFLLYDANIYGLHISPLLKRIATQTKIDSNYKRILESYQEYCKSKIYTTHLAGQLFIDLLERVIVDEIYSFQKLTIAMFSNLENNTFNLDILHNCITTFCSYLPNDNSDQTIEIYIPLYFACNLDHSNWSQVIETFIEILQENTSLPIEIYVIHNSKIPKEDQIKKYIEEDIDEILDMI